MDGVDSTLVVVFTGSLLDGGTVSTSKFTVVLVVASIVADIVDESVVDNVTVSLLVSVLRLVDVSKPVVVVDCGTVLSVIKIVVEDTVLLLVVGVGSVVDLLVGIASLVVVDSSVGSVFDSVLRVVDTTSSVLVVLISDSVDDPAILVVEEIASGVSDGSIELAVLVNTISVVEDFCVSVLEMVLVDTAVVFGEVVPLLSVSDSTGG